MSWRAERKTVWIRGNIREGRSRVYRVGHSIGVYDMRSGQPSSISQFSDKSYRAVQTESIRELRDGIFVSTFSGVVELRGKIQNWVYLLVYFILDTVWSENGGKHQLYIFP
jgi:hypothetical protein